MPHPRILIIALHGWSNAGDATTDVLHHLCELTSAEVLHTINCDDYVDFQVHRPKVFNDETGERVVEWPSTRLYGPVETPGNNEEHETETVTHVDGTQARNLYMLIGTEPARQWKSYTDEVVKLIQSFSFDTIILLGSMFSDTPHSRPIITTVSTEQDEHHRYGTGIAHNRYEGPIGITTVLEIECTQLGFKPVSVWAQVPHYVHSAPSPKATLALLDKLEELVNIVIPRGELLEQANDWEQNINRMAAADEDMTRYIRGLEHSRDEALAAETTGDALALEFEKYLESDPGKQDPHVRPRDPEQDTP